MGSILGVQKVAAGKLGLSLEEYQAQLASGLKWCSKGKHWASETTFHKDTSRGSGLKTSCQSCIYQTVSSTTPTVKSLKAKAAKAVSNAIKEGTLPVVTTLLCECGATARHYHHDNGYEVEHQLDVEPLCIPCHMKRHWSKNNGDHNHS